VRRLLLLTLLVSLLAGIGVSNAQTHTLSCSAVVAPGVKCVYERTLLSVFSVEAAVGGSLVLHSDSDWSPRVTPFFVLSFFGDSFSWWAEVRVPSGLVSFMGDGSTAFTVGFTARW
jgi:hypothetical protein